MQKIEENCANIIQFIERLAAMIRREGIDGIVVVCKAQNQFSSHQFGFEEQEDFNIAARLIVAYGEGIIHHFQGVH